MTMTQQPTDDEDMREAELFCLEIDDDLPLTESVAKLIARLKSRQPKVLTDTELGFIEDIRVAVNSFYGGRGRADLNKFIDRLTTGTGEG